MYDSIPLQIRAQIIRSCNKYGISSPEDVETAYNNFTKGKSIFENLSDSFYRAQDFKKFLEGGVISHKYSGEDEPTGKMTISKLNKKSIVPVSVWHTPKGYTYNLPEVTVTPQSNPDDMLKMRRAINQGMNTAGKVGAAAMAAGLAPYIASASAPYIPFVSKGLGTAFKAMTPSSYTGIFGTGAYNTALGGTEASLAGAVADAGLASYYGAEAGEKLIDNWDSSDMLGNSANAVFAGLAALPMVPMTGGSELLQRIASGALKQRELEAHLSKAQASKLIKLSKERFLPTDQRDERNELLRKYLLKSKGQKGVNSGIDNNLEAQKREKLIADPQATAKKIYSELKEGEEAGILEDLYQQTKLDYGAPVKWNWFDQGILAENNIPPRVATSKALINGVQDTESIMKRFLQNVSDKDGAIQRTFQKLVNDGIIGVNKDKKWVLAETGDEIDPSRFTLNYILENELKSTNRIPFIEKIENGRRHTLIPWHGTNLGDETLIRTYDNPTKKPLFTTIDDGSKGFSSVKDAYGTGASLPVMLKSPEFELIPLEAHGLSHNSNNYGEVGELMGYFDRLPGKAQRVMDVSDVKNIKGNKGLPQNEYNYSTGTPDVKFLFNTFNLRGEKGAFTNAQGGYLTIKNKRKWKRVIN